MKSFNKDNLKVNIYSSRDEMGAAAAADKYDICRGSLAE